MKNSSEKMFRHSRMRRNKKQEEVRHFYFVNDKNDWNKILKSNIPLFFFFFPIFKHGPIDIFTLMMLTTLSKMKKQDDLMVVEEYNSVPKEEDAFGVLPNELVALILIQHVPPIWHVLCQFVCHRWHLLLRQVCSRPVVRKLFTNEAAREGHLEVLQWARDQGCPWDKWTCASATQGGHLEVLQWAIEQGCPKRYKL